MASLVNKTVKGHQYWYIVESRRANGKVKQVILEYIGNNKKLSEWVLQGSLTNLEGRMEKAAIKSYSHGDGIALMKVADLIGIKEILDLSFKTQTRDGIDRSTSIILAAIHRASSPGSKNNFSDWFKKTSLPYHMDIHAESMTSQHFWEQMDGITEDELRSAEDAITKAILEKYDAGLDKLALDYTNYFTYISSNTKSSLAQRGHNKQKRNDLRQCSLALVTSKELGIPLYSHVYEGNKNDQSIFGDYLKLLQDRIPNYRPEEITLVFDGGSNTKKNLALLDSHYICSFSLASCKELYGIVLSDYEEAEVNNKKVNCFRTTRTIWGKERECILTFSQTLYDGQVKELEKNIEKTKRNLQELNKKIHNPKSRIIKEEKALQKRVDTILKVKYMRQIFDVKTTVKGLEYEISDEKIEEVKQRYYGKKLMVTDRTEWTTEEIIRAYREQDQIEKLFRDTKDTNHFSMRPIFHWTDQKIRVHIFICLLGLTLACILQKEVEKEDLKISKDRLLEELSEIRESWITDSREAGKEKRVIRKLEEMNSTQNKIWGIVEKM